MADTVFAISRLVSEVTQRFVDESTGAAVSFGRREPTKQMNTTAQGRVVFVPGLDGKIGDFGAAKKPGQAWAESIGDAEIPRFLKTLRESATVYVWAWDSAAPNDELAQYVAFRRLLDATVRAILLSSVGTSSPNAVVEKKGLERVGDVNERSFGFEGRFQLLFDAPVPDTAYTTVTATGTFSAETDFPDGTIEADDPATVVPAA